MKAQRQIFEIKSRFVRLLGMNNIIFEYKFIKRIKTYFPGIIQYTIKKRKMIKKIRKLMNEILKRIHRDNKNFNVKI